MQLLKKNQYYYNKNNIIINKFIDQNSLIPLFKNLKSPIYYNKQMYYNNQIQKINNSILLFEKKKTKNNILIQLINSNINYNQQKIFNNNLNIEKYNIIINTNLQKLNLLIQNKFQEYEELYKKIKKPIILQKMNNQYYNLKKYNYNQIFNSFKLKFNYNNNILLNKIQFIKNNYNSLIFKNLEQIPKLKFNNMNLLLFDFNYKIQSLLTKNKIKHKKEKNIHIINYLIKNQFLFKK
jgi:hypothetical protein